MRTQRLDHVREVLDDLREEVDGVERLLTEAEEAPTGPDHQVALQRLLPPVRRMRRLAQDAAAEVGAAEAVR